MLICDEERAKIFNSLNRVNTRYILSKLFLESPIYKDILIYTSFLPSNVSITERIYCYENNIHEISKCKKCGKKTKFVFQPIKGYKEYCSFSCTRKVKIWNCASSYKFNNKKVKEEFKLKVQNNEYIECDDKSLLEFINERINSTDRGRKHSIFDIGHYRNNQRELYTIIKKTPHIKYDSNRLMWSERVTCIINNYTGIQKCDQCNNVKKYVNLVVGYTCSFCNFNKARGAKYKASRQHYLDILNAKFIVEKEPIILKSDYFILKCKTCNSSNNYKLINGTINNYIKCKNCEINKSTKEIDIRHLLGENIPVYENNKRLDRFDTSKGNKYELDLYFPEINMAIEFNGIYWHSEISGGKNRDYHLDKTQECKKRNIQLIHIFEDEYDNKKNIIEHKLKHILNISKAPKIYARKCIIKEIDSSAKNKFLNDNHIQGEDKSQIKLGLYHNDELVSIMTFCKTRLALGNKKADNQYELSRFASSIKYTVVGAASKLLSYFKKNYEWEEITTYADLRWSNGNLYEKLNFTLDHVSKPNYWYIVDGKRQHRFNWRKNVLKDKLPIFDETLSEWENMKNNGYDRIWDCGNMVYKLKK